MEPIYHPWTNIPSRRVRMDRGVQHIIRLFQQNACGDKVLQNEI